MPHGIRIFGVPGSGKTTKCLEMLEEFLLRYEPHEIAYLSFTRAATREAVDRAVRKFGFEKKEMEWFRTIHSACYKLLELSDRNRLAEDDIKRFCQSQGIRYKKEAEKRMDDERSILKPTSFPDVEGNCLIDFYSRVRNLTGKDIDELDELFIKVLFAKMGYRISHLNLHIDLIDFLHKYKEFKEREGKFDYTDMLMNVLKQKMSPFVKVLINDEAQDNTPLQGKIIGMWCEDTEEYVLAGDDEQCLYSFNEATPEWFLNYPVDEEIILSESYRVPSNILEVATLIVRRNKMRREKNPVGRATTGRLKVLTRPTLEQLLVLSRSAEKNFFLFRINYFEDVFCNQLLTYGYPFKRLLKPTPWTKATILKHNALCKLARGGKINYEEAKQIILNLPSKDKKGRPILRRGLKTEFKKEKIVEAEFSVNDLVHLGVSPYLVDLRNREQIINFMGLRDTVREALLRVRPAPIEKINIITGTIHASKGLEADNIFLFVDYPKHLTKITEEERRIIYVGMTRCRQNLYMVKNYFTPYCLLWGEIAEALASSTQKKKTLKSENF